MRLVSTPTPNQPPGGMPAQGPAGQGGPAPGAWPPGLPPGPPPKSHRGRVVLIVAGAVLALLVVLGIAGAVITHTQTTQGGPPTAAPTRYHVGDCVALHTTPASLGGSKATLTVGPCNSATQLFLVATVQQGAGTCPVVGGTSGTQYTQLTEGQTTTLDMPIGTPTSTVCLAPNLQQGQCYTTAQLDHTLSAIPCTATITLGSTIFSVDKRLDGATDDHLCNPAVSTSTQIYPKPQLVYCLSPAGTPLLGNLTATPLPTIEIPPTR